MRPRPRETGGGMKGKIFSALYVIFIFACFLASVGMAAYHIQCHCLGKFLWHAFLALALAVTFFKAIWPRVRIVFRGPSKFRRGVHV